MPLGKFLHPRVSCVLLFEECLIPGQVPTTQIPKHTAGDKPTRANREADPLTLDTQFGGKFQSFVLLHLFSSRDFLQNPVQHKSGALSIPMLHSTQGTVSHHLVAESQKLKSIFHVTQLPQRENTTRENLTIPAKLHLHLEAGQGPHTSDTLLHHTLV